MNITIRDAEAKDCTRLLELIHELAVYEKAPTAVSVSLEEFMDAGFGNNPVWKSFVAIKEDIIIGFALFYTRYSTWKGRRLFLEDFFVTNEERGSGIGKLLFDRVVQEAAKGNYNGMNWQVLDWNAPAINFYNKYQADMDGEWLNGSFSKEKIATLIKVIE